MSPAMPPAVRGGHCNGPWPGGPFPRLPFQPPQSTLPPGRWADEGSWFELVILDWVPKKWSWEIDLAHQRSRDSQVCKRVDQVDDLEPELIHDPALAFRVAPDDFLSMQVAIHVVLE